MEMYTKRTQNITAQKQSQNRIFILKNEFLGSFGLFASLIILCIGYNLIEKHIKKIIVCSFHLQNYTI